MLRLSPLFAFAAFLPACGGAVEPSPSQQKTPPAASSQPTPPAASSQPTPAPTAPVNSFDMPKDGTPNNNGYVGPFCCTGTTAVARDASGAAIGYAYFYGWKGSAFATSATDSAATDLDILVSGVNDASDPSSAQVQTDIDFEASEMTPGAARSAQAGALTFTVTIETATPVVEDGTDYYDMGTVTVRIDVTTP